MLAAQVFTQVCARLQVIQGGLLRSLETNVAEPVAKLLRGPFVAVLPEFFHGFLSSREWRGSAPQQSQNQMSDQACGSSEPILGASFDRHYTQVLRGESALASLTRDNVANQLCTHSTTTVSKLDETTGSGLSSHTR